MTLRRQWKFAFPASRLVDAAGERQMHHNDRLAWWSQQHAEAERELRTAGVEFRTRQGTHIAGHDLEAVLDPEIQRRVYECRDKMQEHERLMLEFAMYRRTFELSPDATLELDAEDILFFGL